EIIVHMLSHLQPPEHTRLRRLLTPAFSVRTVERCRDRIRALTTAAIDSVEQQGRMDVLGELAYPLPVTIIREMLGIPASAAEDFARWAGDVQAYIDAVPPTPDAITQIDDSTRRLSDYVSELIQRSRGGPGDDLITTLTQAEDRGVHLTEQELISTVFMLLI